MVPNQPFRFLNDEKFADILSTRSGLG